MLPALSARGTVPISINTGVIAGMYWDASCVYHGFVRAANGTITAFSAPGAGTGGTQGTAAISINAAGVVTGAYTDASNGYHGFVRAADGTINTFDAQGAGPGPGPLPVSNSVFEGTGGLAINIGGDIAGTYTDASLVAHGFVRTANGTITTFDAPGAGTGMLQGTLGLSIDDAGDIAGGYVDATAVAHGFVRAANGTMTTFDAPGAGTGLLQGTGGLSINAAGNITGAYRDASGVAHGFVLTPVAYPLTVTLAGTGSGTVTSSPTGIKCPGTCSANFGASVVLTATPNSGSTFGGWRGACSGTGSCTVTMSAAQSATAWFATTGPVLTLLSPSSAVAGGGSSYPSGNGSEFCERIHRGLERHNLVTNFINSTQLQASVPAADIAATGVASLTVTNPTGGGTSNPLTFDVLETFGGTGGFLSMFVNGANLGNSVLFQSGGLVGVGTTSPTRTLDVAGEIQARGGNLFLQRNLTDLTGRRNWAWGTETFNVGDMAFFVSTGNSNAPSVNVMTLMSNGNVGIGLTATTPATTLQVGGDIRVGTSTSPGCVQNFSGGQIAGTCSSDLRLKTGILPFAPVLDKVVKLQPVHFNWKTGEYPDYHFGAERGSGLIAQDVEKVFPDMVGVDEHGYKTVNYSELPYLTLAAIRELKIESDSLRAQLSERKAENDFLRAQLAERQRELEELRQEVEARLARLERPPAHRAKRKTAVQPKPAAAAKAHSSGAR